MGADVVERARAMRDQERQIARSLDRQTPRMRWRVSLDVLDDLVRSPQGGRPPAFQILTWRLFSWPVETDVSLPPGTLLLEPAE